MYKLLKNYLSDEPSAVLRIKDNASIPMDEQNTDYQEYLKFLAEGGTPLPAENE
jgi:hypothetical protein